MINCKFRAWDKNRRELCKVSSIEFNDGNICWIEVVNSDNVLRRLYPTQFEINQSSNIRDNSSEDKYIYEEDTVKFVYENNSYTGVVRFELGSFIITSNELDDGYIIMSDIVNTDGDYNWICGTITGNTYL